MESSHENKDITLSQKRLKQKSEEEILELKKNGILVGGESKRAWVNHAEDIFISLVGEDKYEEKIKKQFKVGYAISFLST